MKKLFFILAAVWMVGSIHAQTLSQTFTWNDMTMRYPAGYDIMDIKTNDDGYKFNCVNTDKEVISFIAVSFYYDKSLTEFNRLGVLYVCQDVIEEAVNSFMIEGCKDLWKGSVTQDNSKSYVYVYQPFTVTMSGIPIKGRMAVFAHDDMVFIAAMLTDDASQLPTLQSIVNTIKKEQ